MSGVGGGARLRTDVLNVRRNDAGMLQKDDVVHGAVRPAVVLLGSSYGAGIFLAQFRHCIGRDEGLFFEVEDETHYLVLTLSALFFAQNERFQHLNLLKRKIMSEGAENRYTRTH